MFPLLAEYPDIFVHACDFSVRAVNLVKVAFKSRTPDSTGTSFMWCMRLSFSTIFGRRGGFAFEEVQIIVSKCIKIEPVA